MQIRTSAAVASLVLGGFALAHAAQPAPGADATPAAPFGVEAGGDATIREAGDVKTFMRTQPNLTPAMAADAALGRDLFVRGWTPALAFNINSPSGDGLGPLFDASTCETCHRGGGRGPIFTLVLKLSVPPHGAVEQAALASGQVSAIGEPVYGIQLQERAVSGATREGSPRIDIRQVPLTLADGTTVTMHQPTYSAVGLNYGPLAADTMLSPRVGPPLIGLGLLEAVDAKDIEALADPDDRNGDGISGRASHVLNPETGKIELGRFGWKAGTPTVRVQAAGAFLNDIGISTEVFPTPHGDCTRAQPECGALPVGGEGFGVEAGDDVLDRLVTFVSTMGVPERRNATDPRVMAGQAAFVAAGCTACHTPTLVTSASAANPADRSQRIWPYSDLLLHDMGSGLADNRPEGDASGSEWRTAPLWGIGSTAAVMRNAATYLHDGRATSLAEAILWHGGEAQPARDRFAALSATDRDALLAFLGSL